MRSANKILMFQKLDWNTVDIIVCLDGSVNFLLQKGLETLAADISGVSYLSASILSPSIWEVIFTVARFSVLVGVAHDSF